MEFRNDKHTGLDLRPSQMALSRTFDDSEGVTWEVVEVSGEDAPGAQGDRCLLFLSAEAARRVWQFPADWRSLSARELEALSWSR